MILTVLCESNNDNELFRNYLMFANKLLEGGNRKVQKTILDFFTSYQKSEVIFQRFNYVIHRQIESITAKTKEKKASELA